MKLTPLHDRIVVLEDKADEISQGGIIIPGQAQKKPATGTVISHGPGKYVDAQLVPVTVNDGDKIVFVKHQGDMVEVDGVEYRIIKDEHIIGIIT